MGFTGAANRVDVSGGFGQGETRPQAFTGLDGKGYLIGRTQDRIIEIADISDPDTSTYVSAVIGNPNSMAAHNGSLYVFIGRDLIRFDTPFLDTDTGTDVFTINETPRALTSDGSNLYYIHQLSVLNFLYRIDDLDGTPNVVALGRVGSGNANIRGLSWHDGFFWGVDATTDKLVKITLTEDSDDPHTVENVGSYSQFVGPITNPQGFGVVNGVGYISALDNDGSLWELLDFKFTSEIADQSWTVGTAVSVSAPTTEDGETPITYAISPALVAGVTLDTSTGDIGGTPTATADATDYTLTATDDNGIETTATFSASVAASGVVTLTATTLEIISGNNQSAIEGEALTNPLIVQVNDQNGDPFQGATVTFSVSPNDATLGTTTATTDSDGRAQTTLTLGETVGDYTVTASATDLTDIEFTATATAAPIVNNAPSFSESSYSFTDAAITVNTIIGTVAATDDDNDPISYSLTGTDAADFNIDSDGEITVANALDNSTTYTFDVVADDDTDTTSVAVTVTTIAATLINNAPSFSELSYSFDNIGNSINTVVGIVEATDDDDDILSYSLTGTDATNFDIDSDGEITVIATLSTSTTYNFDTVADDGTDTTSVAVTVTTSSLFQIAAISIDQVFVLFQKEQNLKTTPTEAGDNDHGTWTTKSTIVCDIRDEAGDSSDFDHIFVRCSGATSYTIFLDNASQGTRVLPSTIQVTDAFPDVDDVAILRAGWQHDLLALRDELSGSSIRLVFTGSNIRISEILILKKSTVENQNYSKLSHSKVDINSTLDKTLFGEYSRSPRSRGNRLRWKTGCQLEFTPEEGDIEVFLDWINRNSDIVAAHDPQLYPWRVYRGKFLDSQYSVPYITKIIEQGNAVTFNIQENRPIGSKAMPELKESFNTEDAQDRYLFFNECIHLNNDRITTSTGVIENRVCDNNFKTYAAETTLIFDIANNAESTKLTHIWLKSSGVTSYAVQTRVSNVWTTQETITLTQKSYDSWDNGLEKLTTAITATSIRLVFTGTDIKISEIMLLEHAGGLVSMRELVPAKMDRNAVTSESKIGQIQNRTLAADRFKWQLDFYAAFAQGNIHHLEDFVDWADSNPNFVFAERPESKPWRVYPASFLNDEFNIELIDDTIQIGEFLKFQVGER